MDPLLRLHDKTVIFSVTGLAMVGNYLTGGIIGLTSEGTFLCQKMACGGVAPSEVPASCVELVEHLRRGGYLAAEDGMPPSGVRVGSAYLHVTQRCDLSCRFCYSDGVARNVQPDPSLADLARAIGLLARLGVSRLVISGGEPFLRQDLPDIVRTAREQGIANVSVLTNGLHVTPERLAPLAGSVDAVAVAFDGCSMDVPAHLRGEQRFDRLVGAIKDIAAAGIQPCILPILHGANLADIPRYRQLAKELGAQLRFSLLMAPTRELGELALAPLQQRELALRSLGEHLGLQADAIGTGVGLSARMSCGAGTRTLSVAADGTVFPCHMLHRTEFAMGNAFADDLRAIMDSSVAKRFQDLSANSFARCGSCGVRHLCGGGCRARAYADAACLEACDSYCELSRVYFNEIVTTLKRCYAAD